jgi:hypothetical protein
MVSSNKGKALQSSEKVVIMKKYRKAMRRIFHMFNMAKRDKNFKIAFSALESFWGIKLVAIEDAEISVEDFEKIQNLYDPMMRYIDRM